nr:hypothetical protein [Burkholderia alba]
MSHKDSQPTVLRTVYGKVTVISPRLWSCTCQRTAPMLRPARTGQQWHDTMGHQKATFEIGFDDRVPIRFRLVEGSIEAHGTYESRGIDQQIYALDVRECGLDIRAPAYVGALAGGRRP